MKIIRKSPVVCDTGGRWRITVDLCLTGGERDMLDRPGLTLIADGFELCASNDPVKTDLELTCSICGEHLCDAETGDELSTLAGVAADHQCLRTPAGVVITRAELDAVHTGRGHAYDLVPCADHLDYTPGCGACRIIGGDPS